MVPTRTGLGERGSFPSRFLRFPRQLFCLIPLRFSPFGFDGSQSFTVEFPKFVQALRADQVRTQENLPPDTPQFPNGLCHGQAIPLRKKGGKLPGQKGIGGGKPDCLSPVHQGNLKGCLAERIKDERNSETIGGSLVSDSGRIPKKHRLITGSFETDRVSGCIFLMASGLSDP